MHPLRGDTVGIAGLEKEEDVFEQVVAFVGFGLD